MGEFCGGRKKMTCAKFNCVRLAQLFILILIIVPNSAWAENIVFDNFVDECVDEKNISCTNCVAINLTIMPGEGPEYVVGDYFYYNISFRNIGSNTINFTFGVRVYNPSREEIKPARTYGYTLQPKKTNYSAPTIVNNQYNIYDFDTAGSYKLEITSEAQMTFYRFYNDCRYTFRETYVQYFDAMPRWEKEWREEMISVQESSSKINEEMKRISERIELETLWLLLLTLAIAYYTIFGITKKHTMAILGVAITFFILIFFGWPILLSLIS